MEAIKEQKPTTESEAQNSAAAEAKQTGIKRNSLNNAWIATSHQSACCIQPSSSNRARQQETKYHTFNGFQMDAVTKRMLQKAEERFSKKKSQQAAEVTTPASKENDDHSKNNEKDHKDQDD